jgi:hypothetical protein
MDGRLKAAHDEIKKTFMHVSVRPNPQWGTDLFLALISFAFSPV